MCNRVCIYIYIKGGWWQCAAADRGVYCQCNGVARLVDIDRTALSSAMVDVGAAGDMHIYIYIYMIIIYNTYIYI